MDDHINVSRECVESGSANDDVGVAFADGHMWLGAEEAAAVHSDRVENGGLVRAEDLGIPVRDA